ncbi:Hypothetical protein CKL_2891 [Clostridium kluyveri DSM 555]|uniref:Uncharacterized protein n=1 Tax=Clostridium kluyveri (strain ATCC 8527 / DSM 555 / NBRC 12016 / NCIMB 10680 / K1) TaxID=431943 RepID=A5N1A7_CLOK5|nr:Hypothetical protein CKL_2891 [Clostridium kluyveri DSM 555]
MEQCLKLCIKRFHSYTVSQTTSPSTTAQTCCYPAVHPPLWPTMKRKWSRLRRCARIIDAVYCLSGEELNRGTSYEIR